MWKLADREVLNQCTDVRYPAGAAVSEGAVTTAMPDPDQGPPLSCLGSRLAIRVHQGSDPTQPYQTSVIRQSATLPYGFSPGGWIDVVRSLAWMTAMKDSLPLIGLILSVLLLSWPRRRGESLPTTEVQIPASSGAGQVRPPAFCPLLLTHCVGESGNRGAQIAHDSFNSNIMFNRICNQFTEDVVPLPATGMPVRHPPRHHLGGDAAESPGHPDANAPCVFALEFSLGRQAAEMIVVRDQVVRDHHDRPAKTAVGTPDQLAVGAVDFIALVPGGKQACPTGDRAGHGVILNRPHLAGELRGRDDDR